VRAVVIWDGQKQLAYRGALVRQVVRQAFLGLGGDHRRAAVGAGADLE
jgi:hypothetical protein